MGLNTPHSELSLSLYDNPETVNTSTDQIFGACFSSAVGGLTIIEQVAEGLCSNTRRPMMVASNPNAKAAVFFSPRCKSWHCPECANINRRLWTWVAAYGSEQILAAGQPIGFFTVTSHEKLSNDGALRALPSGWAALRKRVQYVVPSVAYLLIPEPTLKGKVHLHGIVSADLSKRWWKDNARACGFGYQADAQRIEHAAAVAVYTAGYIGKQLESGAFGKGFHRVRTSQNWQRPPDPEEYSDWVFETLPPERALQASIGDFKQSGYQTVLADHRSAWTVIASLNSTIEGECHEQEKA